MKPGSAAIYWSFSILMAGDIALHNTFGITFVTIMTALYTVFQAFL